MRLSFDLQEDAELRKAVRKMVIGELKGWLREEIQTVVRDVITEKVNTATMETRQINSLIQQEVKMQAREIVLKELGIEHIWGGRDTREEKGKALVRKMVFEILTEWVLENVKNK